MNRANPEKPHIVFLFSDTGGGHRSAAQAIIEALELEFPGQTTQEMVDIFREYAPPPLHLAPEISPPLSRMSRVWGMGYHLSDGPARTRLFYQMLWPYIRWGMRRLIREHPADLYVSVHQLVNTPMTRALAGSFIKSPFVTVVTDLVSTHAAWFSNRADLVIVPTETAYQRGLRLGLKPDQMRVVGLPVADRYCHPAGNAAQLRQELGWPQDRPIALLVGGGEGMGPLEAIAKEVNAACLPLSMVIIAGRNKKLKEKLEKYPWQVPTRVYGFVQQMPDFMRAADILVTKAGPGTICEAFIAGLPIILYSRVAGQEEGNVDYVVDQGAGVWAPRPELVVEALRAWLVNPEARPNAARDIARLLLDQIQVKARS